MLIAEFELFGVPLVGFEKSIKGSCFLEQDLYSQIKREAEKRGWNYHRLETVAKDGMPDILVTRGLEYALLEIKRLRKKELQELETDLHWQFGQLAFMRKCFRNDSNYILVVTKSDKIIYLKDKRNEAFNFPDFVEFL